MKRWTTLALAGALLTTTLTGLGAAPALAAGTFTGRVVDATGTPIAGAHVIAAETRIDVGPASVAGVVTDADGHFELQAEPRQSGDFQLAASADGFVPGYAGGPTFESATTYPVIFDEVYRGIQIMLPRASSAVNGTITAPDGSTVADATVEVTTFDPIEFSHDAAYRRTVHTDEYGQYRIESLAPGRFLVEAVPAPRSGLLRTPINFPDLTDRIETLPSSTTTVDIRLLAPGSISGTITDPNGAPVPFAFVTASGFPEPVGSQADASGRYTIDMLYPGPVNLIAAPSDDRPLLTTTPADQGVALPVVIEGTTTQGADLELLPGVRVTTTVSTGVPTDAVTTVCTDSAIPSVLDDGILGATVACDEGRTYRFIGSGVVPVGPISVVASPNDSPTEISYVESITTMRGDAVSCIYDQFRTGAFECDDESDPSLAIDTTRPTIVCPANEVRLLNEPDPTLTATVTDDDARTIPSVTAPIRTGRLGQRGVVFTATDPSGNIASKYCRYTIGVTIASIDTVDGFAQVRVDRNLPIRYRAVDFNGDPVTGPRHFVGVDFEAIECIDEPETPVRTGRIAGLRRLGNGGWLAKTAVPADRGCYLAHLQLIGATSDIRVRVR